ncbi:hypothetical protein [Lacipirellula sp.]|uniref:hypothetical protein n=1 Tax=Lacipirellula sp. TaxID=2691419 RepID=UPI003D0B85A3
MPTSKTTQFDRTSYVMVVRFFPGFTASSPTAELASKSDSAIGGAMSSLLARELLLWREKNPVAARSRVNIMPKLAPMSEKRPEASSGEDPRSRAAPVPQDESSDLDLLSTPTPVSPWTQLRSAIARMQPGGEEATKISRKFSIVRPRRISSYIDVGWLVPDSRIAGRFLRKRWGALWSPAFPLLTVTGTKKAEWIAFAAAQQLCAPSTSNVATFNPVICCVKQEVMVNDGALLAADVGRQIARVSTGELDDPVVAQVQQCQREVESCSRVWNDTQNDPDIPRKYQSIPIAMARAAELLGIGEGANPSSTISKRIASGKLRATRLTGHSSIFDVREFPASARDEITPAKIVD